MRKVTERPEGIDAGVLKLVGTSTETIVNEATAILSDDSIYQSMTHATNPYGDGKTSEKIVRSLQNI